MEIVFDEIVPQYAIQLMQDVFGNYVRLLPPGLASRQALSRANRSR